MISDWLMKYESVLLLAAGDRAEFVEGLVKLGISSKIIDYNPKYSNKENYICKDFIFDNVELNTECIVHYNCEKTWPIGKIYKGDMILIGDNDMHNGDCNPISSHEQLIEQNGITEVYNKIIDGKHFIVYGSNLS